MTPSIDIESLLPNLSVEPQLIDRDEGELLGFPLQIAESSLAQRHATGRSTSPAAIGLGLALAGLLAWFILEYSNLIPQSQIVQGRGAPNSSSRTGSARRAKSAVVVTRKPDALHFEADQLDDDAHSENQPAASEVPVSATSDTISQRSLPQETVALLAPVAQSASSLNPDRILSLAMNFSHFGDQNKPSTPIANQSTKTPPTEAEQSGPAPSKKASQPGKTSHAPDTLTAHVAETLRGHDREVNCLTFSPNGRYLISGGNEGAYITWDVEAFFKKKKGAKVRAVERRNNSDHIAAVDFDASGNVFACSGVTHWGNGFGCNLAIFTPYRKEPYGKGCDCAYSWTCVAVDPLGRFLVTGSLNRQFKAVSLLPLLAGSGKLQPTLAEKSAVVVPNEVWRAHCHPFQTLTAAGGRDGWIRLYMIGMEGMDDHKVQVAGHGGGGITGLKFTPNGEQLISVGQDKTLKVWNLDDGAQINSMALSAIPEWCDLHPVHPWAVVACQDGQAQILNYETGHQIAVLKGHVKSLRSALFHPEGHWIATAGNDFVVKLWDLGIPSIPLAKRPKLAIKK